MAEQIRLQATLDAQQVRQEVDNMGNQFRQIAQDLTLSPQVELDREQFQQMQNELHQRMEELEAVEIDIDTPEYDIRAQIEATQRMKKEIKLRYDEELRRIKQVETETRRDSQRRQQEIQQQAQVERSANQERIEEIQGTVNAYERLKEHRKGQTELTQEEVQELQSQVAHVEDIAELNDELDQRRASQVEISRQEADAIEEVKQQEGEVVEQLHEQRDATKEQQAADKQRLDEHELGLKEVQSQQRRVTEEQKASGREAGRWSKTIDNIKHKLQHLVKFAAAAFVWRELRRYAREAIQIMQDLDREIGNIAAVTEKTREQLWGMMGDFTDLARDINIGIRETVTSAAEFYDQGYETAEALQMVEAAGTAATVAGMDMSSAVENLTAAMRGYNMEASEAMGTMDTIAALAAESATGFDEVSTAMTRVATLARESGLEFDHTAAFLTKMLETTQDSADAVGSALMTILARMSEIRDAGEVDDMMGDTTDINDVEEAYRSAGVEIRDATGNIRDLHEPILELSDKWQDLDRETRRYITSVAAGTRMQTQFIALMEDAGRTHELLETATTSSGEATRQFDVITEGLDAKIRDLNIATEEFMMNFREMPGLVGNVISGATRLLEIFGYLGSQFGTLGHILSTVVLVAMGRLGFAFATVRYEMIKTRNAALSTAIAKKGLAGAIYAMMMQSRAGQAVLAAYYAALHRITDGNVLAATGTQRLRAAFQSLIPSVKGAAKAFWAKNAALLASPLFWIGAVIAGVVAAFYALATANDRLIASLEEHIAELQELERTLSEVESGVDSLIEEYEDLTNAYALTTEEMERFQEVSEELSEAQDDIIDALREADETSDRYNMRIGRLNRSLDEHGNYVYDTTQLMEELGRAQEEVRMEHLETQIERASAEIRGQLNLWEQMLLNSPLLASYVLGVKQSMEDLGNALSWTGEQIGSFFRQIWEGIEQHLPIFYEGIMKIVNLLQKAGQYISDFTDSIRAAVVEEDLIDIDTEQIVEDMFDATASAAELEMMGAELSDEASQVGHEIGESFRRSLIDRLQEAYEAGEIDLDDFVASAEHMDEFFGEQFADVLNEIEKFDDDITRVMNEVEVGDVEVAEGFYEIRDIMQEVADEAGVNIGEITPIMKQLNGAVGTAAYRFEYLNAQLADTDLDELDEEAELDALIDDFINLDATAEDYEDNVRDIVSEIEDLTGIEIDAERMLDLDGLEEVDKSVDDLIDKYDDLQEQISGLEDIAERLSEEGITEKILIEVADMDEDLFVDFLEGQEAAVAATQDAIDARWEESDQKFSDIMWKQLEEVEEISGEQLGAITDNLAEQEVLREEDRARFVGDLIKRRDMEDDMSVDSLEELQDYYHDVDNLREQDLVLFDFHVNTKLVMHGDYCAEQLEQDAKALEEKGLMQEKDYENFVDYLKAMNNAYGNLMETMGEDRAKFFKGDIEAIDAMLGYSPHVAGIDDEERKALREYRDSLEELEDFGEDFDPATFDPSPYRAGSDAISDAGDAASDAADSTNIYEQALDDLYNILREVERIERELEQVRAKKEIAETEEERIELAEREVELLEEQLDNYRELHSEQTKQLSRVSRDLQSQFGHVVDLNEATGELVVNMDRYAELETEHDDDRISEAEALDILIEQYDELVEGIHDTEMSMFDLKQAIEDTMETYERELDELYNAIRRVEQAERRLDRVRARIDATDDIEEIIALREKELDLIDEQITNLGILYDKQSEQLSDVTNDLMTQFGHVVDLCDATGNLVINWDEYAKLETDHVEGAISEAEAFETLIERFDELVESTHDTKMEKLDLQQVIQETIDDWADYESQIEATRNALVGLDWVSYERSMLQSRENIAEMQELDIDFLEEKLYLMDKEQGAQMLSLHMNERRQREILATLDDEFRELVRICDITGELIKNEEEIAQLQETAHDPDADADERMHAATMLEKLDELVEEYDSLEEAIKNSRLELQQLEELQVQMVNDLVDDMVDDVMEALAEVRDASLEALDQEIERLEELKQERIEYHEAAIAALEEELEAYNNIIDSQIESIRKEEEKIQKQRELEGLQRSREEVLQELQARRMDDSFEGVAAREELEKELAKTEQDLEDFKREEEMSQREKALEAHREEVEERIGAEIEGIEAVMEKEIEKYERGIEYIEEQKEAIEEYYDTYIDNEEFISELRKGMHAEDFREVERMARNHGSGMITIARDTAEDMVDETSIIGEELQGIPLDMGDAVADAMDPLQTMIDNTIDGIRDITKEIEKIKDADLGLDAPIKVHGMDDPDRLIAEMVADLDEGVIAVDDPDEAHWTIGAEDEEFGDILGAGRIDTLIELLATLDREDEVVDILKDIQKESEGFVPRIVGAEADIEMALKNLPDELQDVFEFVADEAPRQGDIVLGGREADWEYADVPDSDIFKRIAGADRDETLELLMELFRSWGGTLHSGGIVGGSSNNLSKAINELFNTSSNEKIVKVLKGELMIPQDNIRDNFIPNMKNMMEQTATQQSSDNRHINFNLNIEKFTGTKKEANELLKLIEDKFAATASL